jgi:uncharacterized lipoprotein YddW (UPF0748 family)
MRALWVDQSNPGFHNPAEVDELVANAVAANMNTLFVQVRRHGDAMYNAGPEPRAVVPGLAPAAWFDPLAMLLQKAHAAELRVHAWLVISVACRNSDPLRGNPQHLCTQHGPSAPDPARWTTATYNDTQVGDLDFGHPQAVIYMESVVQNLLHNYPALDGIHYDYVRYADQEYGYNAISLARFNAAYARPQNTRPTPTDPQWSQWRRDRITELVRRLYIRIKAINPRIQVSAATITWGGVGSYSLTDWPHSAAYNRVFQDWKAWLQEGILDFAVPMHYFAEQNQQQRGWYDSWLAWDRANAGRRAIVAGTGAWLNSDWDGIAQIQRALTPDANGPALAGASLFSYHEPLAGSNPDRRRAFMQQLRETVFAQPAGAPDGPWIAAPTTGHVQGMAAINGRIISDAHMTLFLNGGWAREFTGAVDGWYGAVDLAPGSYTIVVQDPHSGEQAQYGVVVRAGQVTSGP